MAMLVQVDAQMWVKLPPEIQQLIIRESHAEIANKGKHNSSPNITNNVLPPNNTSPPHQASANLTEIAPDDDTYALMLSNIDTYLAEQDLVQEEEDSDTPYEVWGCATRVVDEGQDTAYPTMYLSSNDRQACKLHITGHYHPMICDNTADTTVTGQGWKTVAYSQQKVNVVGFDAKAAIKRGLPVVTAITVVDIGDKTYLFKVHKAVLNEDSPHSLIGEFR